MRLPLEPGTWGKPSITGEHAPFESRARYRLLDGTYADVRAHGSSKSSARDNLLRKLRRRQTEGGSDGITGATKTTVLLDAWLARREAEGRVTPQTLAIYRRTTGLHVRPGIGALALRELNVQRLDLFLMDLATDHQTEAKRAKTILRGALKLAASYGAVQLDLSALFVVPRTHLEVRALQTGEADMVFHAIDSWRNGPDRRGPKPTRHLGDAFRIMLGAGLRIGEVLALRKMDAHPGDNGEPWRLGVNGTIVTPDRGKTFRQPKPKTPSGVRNLPVPAFVGEVLAARLELIADATPEALLFYSRNGTPLQPGNLRRTWRTIRSATEGLEFVIPHTLRKTLATLLADTDPYYAAAYLGHGPGTAVLFAHYVERNRNLNPAGAAPLEGLAPKLSD